MNVYSHHDRYAISVVIVVTLIIVIAVGMGALTLRYLENQLVETAGISLAVAATDIAGKLDLLLAERYGDLKTLVETAAFQVQDPVAMAWQLTLVQNSYPVYAYLAAADAGGILLRRPTLRISAKIAARPVGFWRSNPPAPCMLKMPKSLRKQKA